MSNPHTDKNNNPEMKIPAKPFQYMSNGYLDLTELDHIISKGESERQEAFDTSAKIKVLITHTKRSFEQTQESEKQQQDLEDLIKESLPSEEQAVRKGNLTYQFQEYARLKAYQYFLTTGKVIPKSMLPPGCSDEEYLAGSIIGLTKDLSRYVIGKATVRDAHSVSLARDVVQECLTYLMTFNFRNGMLRRKYDGVKYALKTCETVLYELSVTGMDVTGLVKSNSDSKNDEMMEQKTSKRLKVAEEEESNDASNSKKLNDVMPYNELEELRLRMEHRDEQRETLIKRCRDAQKAAKQAIFALHRSDNKRAKHLIEECETVVKRDLLPIVQKDPALHHGSFSNVMEEYAEAKLFYFWLNGTDDKATVNDKPNGLLMQPNEFTTISLEPDEYLGGLCDLTGEIGRFAVQRGTARDSEGVKFCMETNLSILFAMETLQRFPSGSSIHKKMDQLRFSVEKLERMLYELSLLHSTGRRIVADSMNEAEMDRQGKDDL